MLDTIIVNIQRKKRNKRASKKQKKWIERRIQIQQIRNEAKLRKPVITFEGGRPEEDADSNDGRNIPNPDALGVSNMSPVNEDNLDANDNMDSPGTSLYLNDFQSDRVNEDNKDDDESDNHCDSNEESPLSCGRPQSSFLDNRCNEAVENAEKPVAKVQESNDEIKVFLGILLLLCFQQVPGIGCVRVLN